MNKQKRLELWAKISDIILIGSAILSIVVSFLDFIGVLGSDSWISRRVPALILLGVSFILVSVVIERVVRLDTIQATLDGILAKYTMGVQYLENSESVVTELERIARQANEYIMALGSRATAWSYLRTIQDALRDRGVTYYRLVDGTHITHELHEHLQTVLQSPKNVRIAWTSKEKFGNLTVTEDECIIAFPAPYRNKLSALRLPGETNSRRYAQYFLEAFTQSHPIRTERSLEILCEKCRPTTRDSEEIKRFIEADQSTLNKQDDMKPDLL